MTSLPVFGPTISGPVEDVDGKRALTGGAVPG